MIPNNQFWLRQIGQAYPPVETGYEYVAEWMNLAPTFSERDGIVIFETAGKLRMIGGWSNPIAFPPNSTTNQQWETPDGITWTQIADAPWVPRHNFAHGFRNDGFFWLWGGDGSTIPTGQRDVWKYSTATDWVQVTTDWGNVAGDRTGHSFCVHKDYMYVIGGTIADCARSNDGITWTKMSDLPVGLVGFTQGYACSHRGDIYLVGGTLTGGQNKVFKSSDDGATWIQMPDLANDGFNAANGQNNTSFWCRLISWNTKLFYCSGASDGGNTHGMWYSEDGAVTWKPMYSFPVRQRHAQGYNTFGDDLYIVAGNNAPDSNRVFKTPIVPLANKAVYSVRKAVPTYSGPCMRVKPLFTAAVDIGFDGSGNLDTAALTAAAGGLNMSVETWYDQSGNGNHMTQADTAKQPFIYLSASGGIQMLNGKPAIKFTLTTQGFQSASMIECGHHYIMSFVAAPDQINRQIIANSTTFDRYGVIFNNNGTIGHKTQYPAPSVLYYSGWVPFVYSLDTQYIVQLHRNRMRGKHYLNGVGDNITTSTFERYDTDFNFDKIGREGISFTGFLQEVNVKAGYHEFDQAASIEADINGYFAVH